MKKGTKVTVFIASMALTIGSLLAFVGPRHCGYGMHGRAAWMNQHHGQACDTWNTHAADSAARR